MRTARNLRNLNDNREVEANVENYRKKKLEKNRLSKIQTSGLGMCINTIYYDTVNN